MVADTTAVEAAVIAILSGDASLMALCPGGVHWDLAPAGLTAFVIVSQIDHDDAYAMTPAPMWERPLYLIKATTQGASRVIVTQAAARIYALLHEQPLAAAGYTLMLMQRIKRVPNYLEVDELTDERWAHCGGHYEILVSPTS
jgi:hypothetical protein